MEANHTEPPDPAKGYQYLWEEFKYRHDLIWQRVFQFTTAIVLISIIPYIQRELASLLGNMILVAPVLAIFLALFVLLVVWHELALFENSATVLMHKQNELFGLNHDLNAPRPFGWFVMAYLFILLVLTVINYWIVQSILIPKS